MFLKNIITSLCFGVISGNALFAQETLFIQGDSAKYNLPEENRMINIPFGKTSTKINSGSITIISPDELLRYDNVSTVNDAMSGRIPGLYSTSNLRGLGNALIVIDGIPRSASSVNLSEVEQITVLKDANSAMFYGVMAKNGVILITTKRGQANHKRIGTYIETGFGKPISYPKYLGSADYMEIYNEALVNDGLDPTYSSDVISRTRAGTNPYKYPDTDYYNSTFLKNSKPYSRIETEFTGGSETAQYYANVGWQRSGGLMNMGESLTDNRLNLRSNMNFRINHFIKSHVDIATVFNIANVLNSDFFSNAATLKPNEYPPLIDISLVHDENLIKTASLVRGENILGGTSIYRNNAFGDLLLGGYNKSYSTVGMFNVGVDFDLKSILNGLSFKTYTNFDFYNVYSETQNNTYAIYEPRWFEGSNGQDSLALNKIGSDKFTGTQGIDATSLSRIFSVYGMFDYSRTFGELHSISATFLGYFDQYNQTLMAQPGKHTHLGTRINYIYNNKYMINFSSAIVSSPKLAPGNRIGFSPSISLGWITSEEGFMKDNSVVDYLKLKLSAGIINSDESLTRYYSYDDILVGSWSYLHGEGSRNQSSVIFSNVGNNKLFYEKRKEFSIGAELAVLNNSLWIDATYFNEAIDGQYVMSGLVNTYPAFLGGLNPVENYGKDNYSGFELGISWRKAMGDFNIQIEPSMLFLNTKVVQRDEFYGEDYLYRKGKSTGAIFGLEAMGLFKSEDEIASHAQQMFGIVKPGDVKYKDQNDDGIIDSNDEIMIGDNLANFVGGLSLRMNYNNFTFFAMTSARSGAQRFFSNSYYWVYGNNKYSEVVMDRWTPQTAETATYPRMSSRTNNNNFRSSTFWLENNSLISLDRLQLTYDLSPSIASKLYTRNLSLYARASNIFNIAENKDKMELNIGSEPQYRNYSFGLKAGF